jgi:pulcherriminic acid synthase
MSITADPVGEFHAVVEGRPDVDRYAVFARLRDERPVFYSDQLDAWVLSRYDDVRTVLEDEERFWSLTEGRGAPIYGRSLLQWRGREHNKKAGPVVKRIRSPRAVTGEVQPAVRAIAARRADMLPVGEPVDLKAEYAMWVPLLVICDLLDVSEAAAFVDWYHAIASGGISSIHRPGSRDDAFRALEEVKEFLEPIIEERRRSPGEDMISDLATATYDDEPLPHVEIVATVAFLLTAGVETSERLLTSLLRRAALDPAEWAAIREHAEDEPWLTALAAEALRFYPPVQGLTRRAEGNAEFHGQAIGHGQRLVVLLAAANRDPAMFDDPDRFDPARFAAEAERQFTTAGRVLPFGAGRHHCAGSRLAKVEIVEALAALGRRFERLHPAGELPEAEGLMLRSPPALPVVLEAAV